MIVEMPSFIYLREKNLTIIPSVANIGKHIIEIIVYDYNEERKESFYNITIDVLKSE